jgi:2-iminobutanoate/2-iminopropanoate deaminase
MSQLTKTIVNPPQSPPAVGPYNHAVRVGDLLFCSGQIPVDPANPSAPLTGDIQAQTTQALLNVQAILDHQGLTFAQVVKSTVFMTDLSEFSAMNEVYARFFPNEHPARSTIQVAALPRAAKVEIEIIAHF